MSGFGLPDPMDPTGSAGVSAIPAITKPEGVTFLDVWKYYWNTIPSASMHRKDGTPIRFDYGFYKTNIKQTQEYLDKEIADGNCPSLRYATDEEIDRYNMRVNPTETIRGRLTAEVEDSVRASTTAQILATLRAKGIQVSEADLQEPKAPEAPASSALVSNADLNKLAGTDELTKLQEKLATGIKSGSGTILPSATLQQSSIVGSDKIKDGAAGGVME